MAEDERTYTIDEANAALGELRKALERIREARDVVVRGAEVVRGIEGSNGGGREGSAAWEATRVLGREVEMLAAAGIILRDAETGLIDFPSRREGRIVYLCWRPEEASVAFWHEIGSGFAGRKPL